VSEAIATQVLHPGEPRIPLHQYAGTLTATSRT